MHLFDGCTIAHSRTLLNLPLHRKLQMPMTALKNHLPQCLKLRALGAIGAAALLAGCASMAVTEDALTTNTARALGLEKSAFQISDRVDSGVQTTYTVRTNASKTYSCYVTGTVSVTGRIVSDAVCSELGKARPGPAAPPAASKDASCNALLRAAGRCT
jgi:hypothetical protein